jgi:hypothetical protein
MASVLNSSLRAPSFTWSRSLQVCEIPTFIYTDNLLTFTESSNSPCTILMTASAQVNSRMQIDFDPPKRPRYSGLPLYTLDGGFGSVQFKDAAKPFSDTSLSEVSAGGFTC